MNKNIFRLLGLLLLSTTALAYETVGLAASYNTTMYKSDGKLIPVPLINLNYKNLFLRGLKPGFKIYQEPEYEFSIILDPLGGYFDGWAVNGSDLKSGYDNISDRKIQFMYGLEMKSNFHENLESRLSYLWGDKGSKGELSFTYIGQVNDRLMLMPQVNIKYYNNKFVDYYISTDEDDVKNNSKINDVYRTNDSFTVGVSLTAEYAITEQATLNTFIGYDYFDKKIKNSPIVDKSGQIYGGIGIRYSF